METSELLTQKQAAEAVGCSLRRFPDVLRRAQEATDDQLTVEVFGRTLVLRSAVETLRRHHFTRGSAMWKVWGASGGTTKAANARKRTSSRGNRRKATGAPQAE